MLIEPTVRARETESSLEDDTERYSAYSRFKCTVYLLPM